MEEFDFEGMASRESGVGFGKLELLRAKIEIDSKGSFRKDLARKADESIIIRGSRLLFVCQP